MFIEELEQIIKQRQESPDKGSYTASLFEGGMDRILKKVGEEAGEAQARSAEELRGMSDTAGE